ncbi:MAG: PD-(D/E)XK nuclease family protein, partial [archaeon]
YEVSDDRSVAVVGYEQLTQLERSILPNDADRIDLFADEPFDHPPFHIFDSSGEIVDAVLDTVTAENAEQVAVVLEGASHYSSLVESALEAADIPFYGGPGFIDDPDHRAFLRLLRLAYRGSETTVNDVRPICTHLGIEISVEHDEKRVEALDSDGVSWISEFAESVHYHTFAEALSTYEERTSGSLDVLREELDSLGVVESPVTERRVQDLAYYLQSYEVPVERENEGVLLADAKASGYVDRPVVFFLGMDEGWTQTAPQRPWVDTDAQYDRYIHQFQLLLQSGTEQYYLVQDSAGGRPVTPCLYFGELLEEAFEGFSDLESVEHTRTADVGAPGSRTADVGAPGFDREEVEIEPTTIDTISQSSLNSYVNCPRDYLFGRLLDSPDRDYFREGNLFHDFAEFYVNHPDVIGRDEIEEIVGIMLEEAGQFFTATAEPLRTRKYRIGLETIVEYLDEHGPENHDFLTPASGWGRNFFADYFDEPIDSPITERWFENTALGAKGKIDLVRAPNHLVDHKSGSRKSEYRVVKNASIDPPDDTPNFQAALYLAYFRTEQPDRRIDFTFFHFLETLDDVIAGEANLEDTLTTVTYYPQTFDEFVGSRDAYDELLDGYNDCVATFDDLGFDAYEAIIADLTFPDTTEKDELRESAFAEAFTTDVDLATSDSVDAEKGCDQAIRALNGIRKRAFFKADLDAFEAFLAEQIEDVNRHRSGDERFPIEGPGGEPNYRRVDHRDLLLEGER